MGFPDSQRDLEYICRELSWVKNVINDFFQGEYKIEENFYPFTLRNPETLNPNQDLMNKLHNHFEILQGTAWGLSDYYKRADYATKFAIRQLNNLCHEAESLMLSQRKKATLPEWVRPSQITTFIGRRLAKHCLKSIEMKKELTLTRPLAMLLHIYVIIAVSLTSNGHRTYVTMDRTLGTPKKCPGLNHGLNEMDSTLKTVNIISDIIQWGKLTYKEVLVQSNTAKFGLYCRVI